MLALNERENVDMTSDLCQSIAASYTVCSSPSPAADLTLHCGTAADDAGI